MDQNLTNKQFHPGKKKNIPSWVFGLFSIGMSILIFVGGYNLLYPWVTNNYGIDLFDVSLGATFFICIISFICAIYGLVKGIKGLKLQSKKLSIIGITLCSVGLLIAIFIFLLNITIMFAAM